MSATFPPPRRPYRSDDPSAAARASARMRAREERNCARWFALYEERCAEPTRRPSRTEVRQLRRELEALRRLVAGEQIP